MDPIFEIELEDCPVCRGMAAPWLNMAMVFPSFSAATRFNAGM